MLYFTPSWIPRGNGRHTFAHLVRIGGRWASIGRHSRPLVRRLDMRLVIVAMLGIALTVGSAMLGSAAHATSRPPTIHHCEYDTFPHGWQRQCETRTGNVITFTYFRTETYNVPSKS